MSKKPKLELNNEVIIIVKTVPVIAARMIEGDYKDYIATLRADPTNTGNIKVGKNKQNCTYPFAGNDSQTTGADLDKLFWKSDNGTEKMHFWMERKD